MALCDRTVGSTPLWKVWRAGYAIANFIHDELLVEVPARDDLDAHAARIRDLMIAGMREVVPDVRIAVEVVASTVWSKQAVPVIDEQGRLAAWSPAPALLALQAIA